MKHFAAIFILFLLVKPAQSQSPEVVKFSRLNSIMNKKNDTTYVVNFWATWCKPCVDELPDFQRLKDSMVTEEVKVLLISLDFREDLRSKVIPFLRRQNIDAKVLLLDETDYDFWINKVEKSWSGALPATLIFNNKKGKRKFLVKKLDYRDLVSIVKPMLN